MFITTRLRDWTLLLLCNLIWASQFVMVKLVQEQTGPVFATFFPMTLAMLFLIPIVWREQRKAGNQGNKISNHDVLEFLLVGVFGQVAAQFFITWGVRWSLASNAALLMLTLPVVTAVMAYFLLGERMTRVRWLSFALALVGVMECSGVEWKELNFTSIRFLLGNLMIFLSVSGSAFYNVYSKKLLRRYSPLRVLLYSYYVVFAFLGPLTIYTEPQGLINLPHYRTTVWVGLLILAVFQYFLSMLIFLNVLTRLDATQAAVSNYLIPFFGVVVAAVVLHERLSRFMVVGGVLVLASTLLVTVYEEHQRARETAGIESANP
jgi:drug/metabolite transporter (DMT)-like permease